jgi:type IV secretory pathway TraG/TraD family ATPase VirD4
MMIGLAQGRAKLGQFLLSPLVAAPLTAIVGLGVGFSSAWLSGLDATAGGMIQAGLGVAVSAGIGYAGGRTIARGAATSDVHQRGTLIAADESRTRSDSRGSRDRQDPDREISIAGVRVAFADETKHFKMIGTTGTGKSTAIHQILETALARGDRAVIADPDGGYRRRFYDSERGDLVLNPFEGGSVKWDIFGEIENAYDVEQLARSLIPDHEGSDRSWRGYSRTFFTAVTQQAHEAGVKDVAELYRLLVVSGSDELRTLVAGTAAQPFLEEHNSRMFESIRSVTSSSVSALRYVADQKGPAFSVRSWVRQGQESSNRVLFIPYKATQIAALKTPVSAWLRLAIFEAMNNAERDQRLWFIVDELDALGQIDGLKDALARLRKFGGRCVLGFQSIAQVSSAYGQGEARTIVENCGNTLILRCSASEGGGTARFASQLIGDREVVRTNESRTRRDFEFLGSKTQSQHFNVEPALLPSQIEQLPDLTGYFKRASQPEWVRVRLNPRLLELAPPTARAAAVTSHSTVREDFEID